MSVKEQTVINPIIQLSRLAHKTIRRKSFFLVRKIQMDFTIGINRKLHKHDETKNAEFNQVFEVSAFRLIKKSDLSL